MLRVTTPTTADELDQVRDLFRGFIAWHRSRHREDTELIDRYFDPFAFEEELASLPGEYAPPDGALLLASYDRRPAGCVALRRIDPASCEMKRMFVYAHLHGNGIGRALAEAVIERAREMGYRTLRLDTSVRQPEAQALYRSFGFQHIEPYYELPEDLQAWLVFMELTL